MSLLMDRPHLLAHLLARSLAHSPTYPLALSPARSLTHLPRLIYLPPARSLTYSLTHSLTRQDQVLAR